MSLRSHGLHRDRLDRRARNVGGGAETARTLYQAQFAAVTEASFKTGE